MTRRSEILRELTLIGLGLVACGGTSVPTIATPGRCGFWEEVREVSPDEGECLWAYSTSDEVVFKLDDTCPSNRDPTCAIVMPGETAVFWGELSRPQVTHGVEGFDLTAEGSCPVSCAAEFGCSPLEGFPEVCVPCEEGDGC